MKKNGRGTWMRKREGRKRQNEEEADGLEREREKGEKVREGYG